MFRCEWRLDEKGKHKLFFTEVRLQNWEKDLITIKRVRTDAECNGCGLNIKSGCFAFGGVRTRFCVKCAKEKYVPMVLKSFEKISKEVKELVEDLELNQAKYERENTLAMLK